MIAALAKSDSLESGPSTIRNVRALAEKRI
jgi:hypothetical protein